MIRVLVSDLDGTLLDKRSGIPACNLRAIEDFESAGGTFVVATGRTELTSRFVLDVLAAHGPVILYNGACLMDGRTGEPLWDTTMEAKAFRPLLGELMKAFPTVCTEVYAYGPVKIVSDWTEDPFIQNEGQPFVLEKLSETPKRWVKVMLVAPRATLLKVEAWLEEKKKDYPPFHGFFSHELLYELISPMADKGVALRKLAEVLGISTDEIAAAGDQMNDLEMLKAAGTAFVPADACEAAKAVSTVLSRTCSEGAIAEAVERILAINECEKQALLGPLKE